MSSKFSLILIKGTRANKIENLPEKLPRKMFSESSQNFLYLFVLFNLHEMMYYKLLKHSSLFQIRFQQI